MTKSSAIYVKPVGGGDRSAAHLTWESDHRREVGEGREMKSLRAVGGLRQKPDGVR